MPDISSLNQQQREAVMHGEGPLMIIAGAGTGKTTVVTKRIEHLILDKKVKPSNILALTFTEKAASEMESRIDEILPFGYTTLWIETFHAFCDRILRQEAIHIGLNPKFELMTEAESLLFLRKHLFEFDLDYFRPLGNPMKFLQGILIHFSRLRDDDISPAQYIAYAKKISDENKLDSNELKKIRELSQTFKQYEDLKAKEGVMDYSDLISNTLKLFRERPAILKQYQQQFHYVFVDEFQDTNFAQNELAILLAGEDKNITVVGDDDQCLPADTQVTTPQGNKKIQHIREGDSILTAVGKGSLGISTVKKVFKNKKKTTFITLKTKSGKEVTATSNHQMFCYVPKRVTGGKNYYVLDEVTRGQSKRIKINFYQCYRNYTKKKDYKNSLMQNLLISHLVHLETTNTAVIKQLDSHAISYIKAKKGIRVRYASSDIHKVQEFATRLATITGGFIEMKSTIGTLNKVNMPALIMPASNLLEGLFIPIIVNDHIYYDEIVSVTRVQKEEIVYDLEVDKTHNFVANGVVVHNSIYRWRGAAIANMLQFRSHFPTTRIIALTKNYRSTQKILDGAYTLIQNNNPDRLEVKENIDKKLQGMRGIEGDTISFIYTSRGEDEAEAVAKEIEKEVKKTQRPYNEFAILVRANDHSLPFQRALDRAGIPFQFLGPGHLYQQPEIKDLIAYLHVLADFQDTSSLYRVITMPVFKLQPRDISAILNFAKRSNITLFEAMEQVDTTMLTDEGKERVAGILSMIKKHLELVPAEQAGQILYHFFEDSGLMRHYLDPDSARTEKEAQNIAKFFEKMKGFAANKTDASVFAVVEWIDLAMELGESPMAAEIDWTRSNAVNILTIHSSKGLEFPIVFVVNLVTQRFPSRDRKEQIPVPTDIIKETLPEGDEGLQEERRLFYVAITRAKEKLYLTASSHYNEGKRERKISPFVIETLGEGIIADVLKKQLAKPEVQQLSLLDVLNSNHVNKTLPATQKDPIDITYISYSQLQTFLTCPLHYKLRYILNLPSIASPALSYGVSVHSTLRDFFQMIKSKTPPSATDIKTLLRKNWISQGFSSKQHELQTYQQAETMLLNYAQKSLIDKPQTIAIEQPFNFWLGKVKIGGRIDRIDQLPDGRIEIIDYKTGKNVPTEKKVQQDLQLSLYAIAAAEVKDGILGKDPSEVKLSLQYLEENINISTTRTHEELEIAKDYILQKIDEISHSSFNCSGSILCKNCEYKMICQGTHA